MPHPIDDRIEQGLGQLSAPEGLPVAKPGQSAVGAPQHPIDAKIDQMLTPVQEPGELEQSLDLRYDPSKDWDAARQALDAATFGSVTRDDDKLSRAKKAWEKENGPAAAAANFAGQTVPSVVLSTVAGQGIFRAGQLASKLAGNPVFQDTARFLTGQLTNQGRLANAASQTIWGAGQGGITGAYNRSMGQNDDVGSEMLLGGLTGPLANMLFAPYKSNVAPEIGKLARDWSAQGLGLSASQLPGSPPILRAVSKMLNLGKSDMSDVTESLMRSTGSSESLLTGPGLDRARAAVKAGLAQGVHSAWSSVPDEKMPKAMSDALAAGVLTPQQAQSVRLAQNQWHNALTLDPVAETASGGVATQKGLLSAMRGARYPGGVSASTAAAAAGNPVDLGTIAQGTQQFIPPGNNPGGKLSTVAGLAGGALGVEGLGHAMPFLEQVMPHLPLMAHGATAYAGLQAAAAPLALGFMASPAYKYLLTHGGVGPIANPLLPSIVQNQNYQDKVDWMKNYFSPATPAQGATGQSAPAAPDSLQPVIASNATKYGVDPDLLTRQLHKESGFQNLGPNKAGATGIAQFVPSTAKQYGIDPTDPVQSVEGQAHYMSDLSKQFGNSGLALAAYNWGPGNVSKWLASGADAKKLPDETRDYVQSVSGLPIENWLPNAAKRLSIPLSPANAPANYFTDNAAGQQPSADNALVGSP